MDTGGIDWVFDASREGTFPKGEGSGWRRIIKYWVISSILSCFVAVAGLLTVLIRPKGVALELVFAILICALIFVFCIFLVWMTYRHARGNRNRERLAEDLAMRREIARYYRENQQQEKQVRDRRASIDSQ